MTYEALEGVERYFVLNGQAFARDGEVPAVVQACAERIDSLLFSVDVVRTVEGICRLCNWGMGRFAIA